MEKARAVTTGIHGMQRASSTSSRGFPPLLPVGLGKELHLEESSRLQSPFDTQEVLDDDADWCARAVVLLGPYLWHWQCEQRRALRKVARACAVIDDWLRQRMEAHVAPVADVARPVMMACSTALLRWPDRRQPSRYLKGFGYVGLGESGDVFRDIPTFNPGACEADLLGEDAIDFVDDIERSSPPPAAVAMKILDDAHKDVSKGYARGLFPREHFDSKFGPGQWRPLVSFWIE